MAEFVTLLWPIFIACVLTFCCDDMLDYVLIYVDICMFRYIDMDGCKLYAVDIIIHDTDYKIWYVNVSYIIHYACDTYQHTLNGCECMVGKSTLRYYTKNPLPTQRHMIFNIKWILNIK